MQAAQRELGIEPIPKLIVAQAIPAAIGILFMTVNLLIDAVFVGRWLGSQALAALTVVGPVTLLFGSVGFALGVGGGSVISRAMGNGNDEKAKAVFANQIMLLAVISALLIGLGLYFTEDLLLLLGAKSALREPASLFLMPLLLGAPFQAFTAMAASVMRAENQSRLAMTAAIIAAVSNIVLDIVLIKFYDGGIFGAALATAISFALSFSFCLWFFWRKSRLLPAFKHFYLNLPLLGEITALSSTTFARQSVITILSVLLNHTLFRHGGEQAVTMYGIISRMLMFALFPVNGITEGFLPVAGFNYGAEKTARVRESIVVSLKFATLFAVVIYAIILFLAGPIVQLFTSDERLYVHTPNALRWVFAASPVIAIQLIGAAYFQAAGKATKALLLTLSKQGFFLIPLILILPEYFGIFGIWIAFPLADLLATLLTGIFLAVEMKTKLKTTS